MCVVCDVGGVFVWYVYVVCDVCGNVCVICVYGM